MTGCNRVFLDTSPLIFFLDRNPVYYDAVKAFLYKVCQSDIPCVTSAVTVEEYCVHPYRDHNRVLLEQFSDFILSMEIDIIPIDETIARKAAQIRAEYRRFKAMDALQLAAACLSGCDLFLTNDKQLKQFGEIRVMLVEELIPSHGNGI